MKEDSRLIVSPLRLELRYIAIYDLIYGIL